MDLRVKWSMFFVVVASIYMVRSQAVDHTVRNMASSNRLETWEGRYVLSDTFSVASNNSCFGMTLYGCLYQHEKWSRKSNRKSGTLFEMYGSCSGMVQKVLSANENIKGVTPVLLKIGVSTTEESNALCLHWHHQGNGGMQRFDQYVLSNNIFRLFRQFEYCDQGDGMQWHEVNDGLLNARCLPTSESVIKTEKVVWHNTNTMYKAIGNTNREAMN